MPTRTRRRPVFGGPASAVPARPTSPNRTLIENAGWVRLSNVGGRCLLCATSPLRDWHVRCGVCSAGIITVTNPCAQPTARPRCRACPRQANLLARVKRPAQAVYRTCRKRPSTPLLADGAPMEGQERKRATRGQATYNSMQKTDDDHRERRHAGVRKRKLQEGRRWSAEKVASRKENGSTRETGTGKRQRVSTVRIYRASTVSPPSHRRNRSERYLVS